MSKCDERIDTPIESEVKDDAAFAARAAGFKSASQWVRWLIHRELYGTINHIQSVLHTKGMGNVRPMGTPSRKGEE